MLPIPPEVIAALDGTAEPGRREAMSMLLTVDADGVPDVCLLSRTELDADPDELRVVITGRKARANLARGSRATLVVFAGAFTYLALRHTGTVDERGFRFEVTRVLRDDIGVPVQPATYLVEPGLAEAESWDQTAALLQRMRG